METSDVTEEHRTLRVAKHLLEALERFHREEGTSTPYDVRTISDLLDALARLAGLTVLTCPDRTLRKAIYMRFISHFNASAEME